MLPDFEDLAAEIRSMRKDLGWSQKELARRAGVSQSLVAKLEQEMNVPNYESVKEVFATLEGELSRRETAGELANDSIVSVAPGDTVGDASEIMLENDFSQIPVKGEGGYVGIVLSKDLGTESDETPIGEVMRHSLPVISHDSPKSVAAELLKTHSATLVKGENGEITGVLTSADLL